MHETKKIEMALIEPPPEPMRVGFDETKMEELIASMRGGGLINAISIMPQFVAGEFTTEYHSTGEFRPEPRATGRYVIVAGHRRFLAAQALGWAFIEAKIFNPCEADPEEIKAQENFIREDVSDFEAGNYFLTLKDKPGMTEERLRVITGKPLSYIYRCMALVQGDEEIALAVHRGDLKMSVAVILNKVTDEPHRRYLLRLALDAGCTGIQAEMWVREWQVQQGLRQPVPDPTQTSPPPPPPQGYVIRCALCGGEADPYNMDSVYIHRHELRAILAGIKAQDEVA